MRLMRWILALATAQLCAWGAIATLVSGCGNPNRLPEDVNPNNRPPSVSGLTATPTVVAVGGRSEITGRVNDPDGDGVSWTVSLEASSTADGTFVPNSAPSRDVASSFRPTRVGVAVIRVLPHDGQNFGEAATVTVTVREGGV